MKKLHASVLVLGLFFGASHAVAIEGMYVGGELGHFAYTGESRSNFNNTIGFGGNLGFRTSALIDLMLGFQYSSFGVTPSTVFGESLTLFSTTATAEFHVGQVYDFDLILGLGPGLYFPASGASSDTKFGINFGGAVDLLVDDNLRVGVGIKAHNVFASTALFSNYWAITARVGYFFNME